MIAEAYFDNPTSRTFVIPLAVRVQESATEGALVDEAAPAVAEKMLQELLSL